MTSGMCQLRTLQIAVLIDQFKKTTIFIETNEGNDILL